MSYQVAQPGGSSPSTTTSSTLNLSSNSSFFCSIFSTGFTVTRLFNRPWAPLLSRYPNPPYTRMCPEVSRTELWLNLQSIYTKSTVMLHSFAGLGQWQKYFKNFIHGKNYRILITSMHWWLSETLIIVTVKNTKLHLWFHVYERWIQTKFNSFVDYVSVATSGCLLAAPGWTVRVAMVAGRYTALHVGYKVRFVEWSEFGQ